MKQLLMLQNKLTGEIPANYAKCTTLIRFRVTTTRSPVSFRLDFGACRMWKSLTSLQFEGPITSISETPRSLHSCLRVTIGYLHGHHLLPAVLAGKGNVQGCQDTHYLLLSGFSNHVCFTIFFVFLKRKERDQDRSLKEESWDVKSFHVLAFSEDEILDSITQENVIGKGGSGNVYKVSLANGKELA
ncbi:hypothetical protein M0R45_027111 [Rubus argutus]|uniref:Uncharacterized protein n=1 Tax=Rubus argutus TaxID=59490 RepID=A0AAW1WZH2_RUBAR